MPEENSTEIRLPELGLVLLVGVSGSGKSSFAAKHFKPTQVISSDFCRGLVSDDETDQAATVDAFDVLHYIVGTRLRRGLLTVVDATSVQPHARAALVRLAKENDVLVDAIVLDVEERVAVERNRTRPDRDFGDYVVRRQARDLHRGLKRLGREGFRRVHVLHGAEEIDRATITYERSWNDRRELTGPFDIVGDVHGCRSELETLLEKLGWQLERDVQGRAVGAHHPEGRTALFVGDLVDRGPDTPGVLRLVMGMVATGTALCVSGNHEAKLVRALRPRRGGKGVTVSHGLAESLEQLAGETEEFRAVAVDFMDGLVAHYVLDGGRLVVAHAGLKESYHGRSSGRVRAFALYGDTTGETDEYGLPVRYPWAREYRGRAMVVYGHTPVPEAEWVNNTICLDTGVVFGGELTALRYPSKELVAVPAEREWYEPVRPLRAEREESATAGEREPSVLALDDVTGTRWLETSAGRVKVPEENAAAALEVMSRFAVDPRWLVYLPPTMSPAATSTRDGFLEHPDQAFDEYAAAGITRVVCEEKHMGSRAVAVVCASPEVAERRFGVGDGSRGTVFTRTGRAFFSDPALVGRLVDELANACAPLWERLDTDWVVLDTEILPWSAKAGGLIRDQYASVGAAAGASLPVAAELLAQAAARGLDVADLTASVERRRTNAAAFRSAYAAYCWPTEGLTGVQVAPFAILASQGRVPYSTEPQSWHLDELATLNAGDRIRATRHLFLDPTDPVARAAATDWWLEITAAGGEGMVVKPDAPPRGRVQPGVKVRGREYLRIIYGPDYTGRLEVLRERHLGKKRSLALREHALGLDALTRFVEGGPLWQVHQAVFAVLALESEGVDPRL